MRRTTHRSQKYVGRSRGTSCAIQASHRGPWTPYEGLGSSSTPQESEGRALPARSRGSSARRTSSVPGLGSVSRISSASSRRNSQVRSPLLSSLRTSAHCLFAHDPPLTHIPPVRPTLCVPSPAPSLPPPVLCSAHTESPSEGCERSLLRHPLRTTIAQSEVQSRSQKYSCAVRSTVAQSSLWPVASVARSTVKQSEVQSNSQKYSQTVRSTVYTLFALRTSMYKTRTRTHVLAIVII